MQPSAASGIEVFAFSDCQFLRSGCVVFMHAKLVKGNHCLKVMLTVSGLIYPVF